MACAVRLNSPSALHPDLIGAAKIVEVVHVLPTEINLQRGKDVGRRQSHFLGFQPVDVGIDRRRASVEQGEYAGEGRVLVGRGDESACAAFTSARSRARHDLPASS